MKFDYETGKDAKMSSKKKKSSTKSKPADAASFSESRPTSQNSGKGDGETQSFSSNVVHEMSSFADRDRFPDGNWPKDGYGKMSSLPPPPSHFNNFNPGFSNMVSYGRNNEDGDPMRIMRNEHYPGYDVGKSGFMNNPGVGRHVPESQLGMLPPRPGFPGGSIPPGLTHGYGTNAPSGFMPHTQTPGMGQQTYPTPTPMLTQLLRYPNPGEKFPSGQMDEYRASGPPKSWMDNMASGMNQNAAYPPQRPSMPFYEPRPMHPQMNQTHLNQISVPPAPPGPPGPHGGQAQAPSGSANAGNPGIFAPPPYIQSCNPSSSSAQWVDANDKLAPLPQQRSSSQPRPMSTASSCGPSLGSPNHIRPISPVPSSSGPAHGHQSEKVGGGSSLQKTSSSSKTKKRKEEVNSIQDISSCDEGGSDSSSSTEVYSQITPMSTPSTTPLPPQSAGGGTKHSPQGSDESPSNTPAPGMAPAPSSGAMAPVALPGSSSSMSLTGVSSLPSASQPSELSHGIQSTGGQSLPGLKQADHVRSSNPCSTFEAGAKPQYSSSSSSYSQVQQAMTAYNSQYSNYGPGNYPRSPGAQQAYRGQPHPNQYGNPVQMYGASAGPPGMHPNQPCGNYPYPGPGKVGQGQYMHGHSQAMPPGMHHPMEMENVVSGGAGKGYGVPGGMYGPGKHGGQSASGSMVNANMPGMHYHPSGMGQSNSPHPGQFGKSGYGAQFGTGPGNGVGPSPHHQHMGPYPGGPYGGHVPPPSQMQYAPRPMVSPVPHGAGGPGIVDHSGMRPSSPAFYRGGPVGYEGDPTGGPMNSSSGRSQWVMNMQGMSGGSLVEAPRGENIPMDMPPVSIPSGAGEIERVRNPAFEPQMGAKDRSSASPISSSDCTSAESKSCESMMPMKHSDPPKMENDFSNASAADSQGRGMMSPGAVPPKSVEMDSSKKDIGSDSNSLPGQERSRPESDKQETLSSPPSTPFNHIASSPASLERDISSPSVHSSKSSGSSSVFNKIADMGSEQDRGIFLERLFSFMSYRGTPITAVPVICKQTVDLYRLYHLVRERGGMVDVTKNKKWREVSTSLNLGASSSAGFTLKRNYAKFLFPFECRYDRGNIDPAPIIASMEMSSKKDSKKNLDRSVDIDNCRPPSNQSFSSYPVPGPLPHGMQMPDMAGRGMHPTMMGPSPSPYNGGVMPGSMGRAGMMSPGGMVPNHSSMSRSSVESLGSAQDTVSIQDPFLDPPGGPGGGQYLPSQGNVNSQMPMYGASGDHPGPMHGPYEHRSNMVASGVPPSPAQSMYSGASNQCMPSSMTGPGNQGNGFGEMCGTSRGRVLNEPGFGNHAIHGNDYGAGGAGYGPSGQGINCQPPGDRFDGAQPGYPGSVPKHPPPSESLGATEQSYYGHYGNQMATSQRYGPGYNDPHFYGGAGQAPVPGYSGPQKMTGPGLDVFPPQGHHPIEGSMIGHAMGPPHPPGPYPMQKQGPGSMGGIPKGDGVYPHPTHDYQMASQGGRAEGHWMQHQYGQHYPPQPYPGSHGMHPNASAGRGPYGMYQRYPVPGMQRYDMEKMQRGPGGPHHLSPNRDVIFPPGSVEATRPKLTKRKRLTHKDMGSVDAWRLMMALRSGLITESTWALDVLTVLLRDDVTSSCLSLSHMPGLLEVLVEHYRRCLILIFGAEFEELEVSSEMQSRYTTGAMETEDAADEEDIKTLPDPKALQAPGNYTLKTHDGKTVGIKTDGDERLMLDHKSWDVFKEFESSAFDWQMGRGDMTLHIITTLASAGSHDFHRKRYFGKNYENLKRKADQPLEEEDKNASKVSIKSEPESSVGSQPINGTSSSLDQTQINSSNSTEENSSDPAPATASSDTNNTVSEVNAKISSDTDNTGTEVKSEDLQEEVTSDKTQSDEPRSKVSMEFDNFDNNLFTCTQLESLKRSCSELDEETYRPNDRVSCRLTDSQLEVSQRCLCLSNIFRNLSFIASNDNEICKHNGLMLILGKLLLLNHQHLPRLAKARVCHAQPLKDALEGIGSPAAEVDSVTDEVADGNTEWWWEMLEGLRENTLVVFANICGQLDLSSFPEEICLPILNGLLHWLVCSSAEALDPLTATGLSPQRLVLEALCKLCVTDSNIDLVLATPPFSRIVLLITNLASMLSERHQQVVREFAVGLLSCLVPGDSSVSRALALQHPSVTLLLEFIEGAEQQAVQMMNAHGAAVLRDNPEIMGTSLDMLCRAASILRHLVDVPENVPLLSRHQSKLMQLVMSQILDRSVTAILADVLNSCS